MSRLKSAGAGLEPAGPPARKAHTAGMADSVIDNIPRVCFIYITYCRYVIVKDPGSVFAQRPAEQGVQLGGGQPGQLQQPVGHLGGTACRQELLPDQRGVPVAGRGARAAEWHVELAAVDAAVAHAQPEPGRGDLAGRLEGPAWRHR